MKRWLMWVAPLVVIAAAPYVRVARFDFVQADDTDLIVANQAFLRDPGQIPAAFERGYFDVAGQAGGRGTYYRPLVVISFMLDAWRGGATPRPYHLTNIWIHAAAVVLLFVLLRLLRSGDMPAFLLAALFAVHPANAQAVCWIPGRNDALMTVFALVSLIGLVVYLDARRFPALWLHVAGFAAALFTKEAALALVPLFALYAALWAGRFRAYRRDRRLFGGYAIVVIAWYVLRRRALAGTGGGPAAEDYALTAFRNAPDLLVYAGKLALPFHLNVAPGLTTIDALLGVVSLAAIGWMLMRLDARRRMFVAAWVALFLTPALLLPGLPAYEHRLYFPLMGILVAASQLRIWSMAARRRVLLAAVFTIQVTFASVAFAHAGVFRNRYTYWTSATQGTPHAGIAHVNLGRIYESDDDPGRAAEHYRRALAIDPLTPGAHNNVGTLLARRGDLRGAQAEFEREIELHPSNADAHFNLGVVFKLSGRTDDAARSWERVIAVDPYYAPAYRELAEYHTARGDTARADEYLEQLSALEP